MGLAVAVGCAGATGAPCGLAVPAGCAGTTGARVGVAVAKGDAGAAGARVGVAVAARGAGAVAVGLGDAVRVGDTVPVDGAAGGFFCGAFEEAAEMLKTRKLTRPLRVNPTRGIRS